MGQRGKKECPKCKQLCGVRSFTCPNCQNPFEAKTKETKETKEETVATVAPSISEKQKQMIRSGQVTISTPAGKPPCKLASSSEEDVKSWIEKTIEAGLQNDQFYVESAIKYYVRSFFDMNDQKEEYEKVCSFVGDYFEQQQEEEINDDE